MGWSNMEEQTTKNGMETSLKILLAIIVCIVMIIILISILLLNIQNNTFKLIVAEKVIENYDQSKLITKINDITYIQIEEFANLVGYEYHKGEYKAFTIEDNKCYVKGAKETSTFFLNDNKVCKLPVNEITGDYREFTVENTIREINGKMYAPIEAINLAFNVIIGEKENSFTIYTLDYLVTLYDKKVKELGYTGIADQSFENQKSLLYGYLIVKKESGLYKIINRNTQEEIVSDKYNSIEFSENTKEFFVTNSLGQVGIINLDGTTKIEPVYESISVLDKKLNLYLIQKDKKYGVVKSGNIKIINPEYDSIGLDVKNSASNIENHYFILDTLIPVCKNNKWGAFDKEGNLIYKIEYDEFGCNLTTVDVNGTKKETEPVLAIKECNGVVVKQGDKYGILDINGKTLVEIVLDAVYTEATIDGIEYYMLYNNQEINIIDRLIAAGVLEDTDNIDDISNNNIENNTLTVNVNQATNNIENTLSNNVVQ